MATSLVVPDVHILRKNAHFDFLEIYLNFTEIFSSWDNIVWTFLNGTSTSTILGKSKADLGALSSIHDLYSSHLISKKELLPVGYKYFGNNNNKESLSLFLKTNPLFASALIASRSPTGDVQYEFNSRSILASKFSSDSNWFKRIVNTLDDCYTRVDAKFDSHFRLVDIKSYKSTKGKKDVSNLMEGIQNKEKVEDACGALLFLLCYYAQVLHVLIHCFHFLMASGITTATSHSTAMSTWASPYTSNVTKKYYETCTHFLDQNGLLNGGMYRTSHTALLKIMREILCKWGGFKTATQFVNDFLFVDLFDNVKREAILNTHICEQFFKHMALINPYATEITGEFERTQQGCIATCNDELRQFFVENVISDRGDVVSSVTTLNVWIELMSVTGMLHGSTLSVSRLMCTPAIISRIHAEVETYSESDVNALRVILGTLVGITSDRHVFSKDVYSYNLFYSFPTGVDTCLDKYSALTATLKSDYLKTLTKSKDFARNGWILTDYCPDGVDGKQLTLTAYV